jgi:hypothetical protein
MSAHHPLPRPALAAVTPHPIAFRLSSAEFACLSAIAERWGTIPDQAACTLLCEAMDLRWWRDVEVALPPTAGEGHP